MNFAGLAPATLDFEDARNRMVDSQIRPNKVTDPRILRAMRTIPRERFVPPACLARAYADDDVPLGDGRVLLEPMILARLMQAVLPLPGERALVIAAGTGYGAAVLAACGLAVTALEEDERLIEIGRTALAAIAPSVSLVSGPLAVGWPAGAPYDLILLEGAVREIPPALGAQLGKGGRLATVRVEPGGTGKAVIAEPTPMGLHAQPVFDCATPLIPSLLPKPGFVF